MQIAITVRAESILAKLAGAPAALRAKLVGTMNRLATEVQRSVKGDKLSGQVLHVRSGNLRRSINREVRNEPDGVFAIVGTNMEYAHIHEYGFSGEVNVREHVRRSRAQMQLKKSKVKPLGDILVRAHTRHVDMPERSFLRSTLRDFEPRIREDLRQAALSVIK